MKTIIVDFKNTDPDGRIKLNTAGSLICIKEKGIELIEGKRVRLDDEERLRNTGTLTFSKEENIWVATIEPDSFIHY